MEGDSDLVCQFHQYGHCWFGPHCRHFHTKKTCSTPMCNQNSCTERHPKPCFYFSSNRFCQFGISCSFLHQSPAPENCELKNNIVKLKEDLQLVITSLNIKDIEIRKLEEKVTELEIQLNNKAFSVQSDLFSSWFLSPFTGDILSDVSNMFSSLNVSFMCCVLL